MYIITPIDILPGGPPVDFSVTVDGVSICVSICVSKTIIRKEICKYVHTCIQFYTENPTMWLALGKPATYPQI